MVSIASLNSGRLGRVASMQLRLRNDPDRPIGQQGYTKLLRTQDSRMLRPSRRLLAGAFDGKRQIKYRISVVRGNCERLAYCRNERARLSKPQTIGNAI
jgi:hypothetical protein